MLKTILVPLDSSTLSERALPYAMTLATKTGAHLVLVHASSDLGLAWRGSAELDAAVALDHIADKIRAVGLSVVTRASPGSPAPTIVDVADETRAELIVMSTHGRGGLGRWIYGSVADEVLRTADRPVLLVSAACDHAWPTDRRSKIMVPLDGSLHAKAAIRPANALADALGAALLLLCVDERTAALETMSPIVPEVAPEPNVFRFGPRQYVDEYLADIARGPELAGRHVDVRAEHGDPAAMIARVARDEQVDLIAMATHGRSGLARLTLGSVTTGVLHRAPVPLLVVRPTAP